MLKWDMEMVVPWILNAWIYEYCLEVMKNRNRVTVTVDAAKSKVIVPRRTQFIESYSIVRCPEFLQPCQTKEIIRLCEEYAQNHSWNAESTSDYFQKTVDLEVNDIDSLKAYFAEIQLIGAVNEHFRRTYGIAITSFEDFFVVKYDYRAQVELVEHFDAGDRSFMIALSSLDDYDGGGTYFRLIDGIIHLQQGDLLSFEADLYHR